MGKDLEYRYTLQRTMQEALSDLEPALSGAVCPPLACTGRALPRHRSQVVHSRENRHRRKR